MRKTIAVATATLAMSLLASCGSMAQPSDNTPSQPKRISKKYVDEAHYKTVCTKKDTKGKCIKTQKKVTDDKDWVLVTSDGSEWDVNQGEYNSVSVGDYWPR